MAILFFARSMHYLFSRYVSLKMLLLFLHFLEVVFYRTRKSGKMVWSVKFFDLKKVLLKHPHNNYLWKYRIWWVVHKEVYSLKSILNNCNALRDVYGSPLSPSSTWIIDVISNLIETSDKVNVYISNWYPKPIWFITLLA